MAKTSAIEKNKHRMRLVKKFAGRRARLKAIAINKTVTPEERFTAQIKLAQLPRNSSQVRVRARCEITGRARAVYRKFRLSRMSLRDLASNGQIPGMVKSSW